MLFFFFIAVLISRKNTFSLKYQFWTEKRYRLYHIGADLGFQNIFLLSWYARVYVTYFHTIVRKPDDSIITSLDVSFKQNDTLIFAPWKYYVQVCEIPATGNIFFSFISHFKWLL